MGPGELWGIKRDYKLAGDIARYIAHALTHVISSGLWDVPRQALPPLPPRPGPQLVVHEHVLRTAGKATVCERCRHVARTPAGVQNLMRSTCVPVLPDRRATRLAAQVAVQASHRVMVAESGTVWCLTCGAYLDKTAKGLAAECRHPSDWGVRARASLLKGLHPRKPIWVGMSRPFAAPGFE